MRFIYFSLFWGLISVEFSAASDLGKKEAMALEAKTGKAVHVGEIFSASSEPVLLVDRQNLKAEVAPYSVVEFAKDGPLRILRGSVLADSLEKRVVRTSTAEIEFIGKVLLSYDHKTQSTSAFVLQGEARMLNPADSEHSLRLDRYFGATMEVGKIVPQLIRQLDVGALGAWMKGYAWPEGRRAEVLATVPGLVAAPEAPVAEHLRDSRLENYFSAIDPEEDSDPPDYYEKDFAQSTAAASPTVRPKRSRAEGGISPEEAAMISLPSTKIDLDFDLLGDSEKDRELESLASSLRSAAKAKTPSRAPASVSSAGGNSGEGRKGDGLDPDISLVLQRLRSVRPAEPVISRTPINPVGRSPASSGAKIVPDPVYDLSENF